MLSAKQRTFRRVKKVLQIAMPSTRKQVKTSENKIIGTPTSTAKACGEVAVPLMTGIVRSTTGKPHVEKEGTTAVAIMDDAIEMCAIPHRVNI